MSTISVFAAGPGKDGRRETATVVDDCANTEGTEEIFFFSFLVAHTSRHPAIHTRVYAFVCARFPQDSRAWPANVSVKTRKRARVKVN